MAIMLYEQALRIFKDALDQHPTTARTMSSMGASYSKKGQDKKAIELHEQALGICERTVGTMHRDAAATIYSMSSSYAELGDFVKAEELGVEALRIFKETLGHDHEMTKMARYNLANILEGKRRGVQGLRAMVWTRRKKMGNH